MSHPHLGQSVFAHYANSFIFDRWSSYLAKWLSMLCRLQRWFQVTDVTLGSKARVKQHKICLTAPNMNSSFIFDQE